MFGPSAMVRAMLRCGALLATVFICLTLFAGAGAAATSTAALSAIASAQLCGIVGCQKPPAPVITLLNPASVVQPGGAVLLRGTNFMDANGNFGKAVLILSPPASTGAGFVSRNPWTVSGVASFGTQYPLENLRWGDTAVYGTIPANIAGVTDQLATFEILRSDGSTSSPFTPQGVQFYATRTFAVLPMSDVQVKCSQAADQNQCNGWADYSPPLPLATWYPYETGFSVHTAFLTKESGDDLYGVALKNGWIVIQIVQIVVPDCGNGQQEVHPMVPQVTWDMGWIADPNPADPGMEGQLGCYVSFGISGPFGVPWK